MKKLLEIEVQGKSRKWGFLFEGDPKHLADWRADGLVVDEVLNIIPEWVVSIGMVRQWCVVQDLLNFKNPFKRQGGKNAAE